MIEGAPANVVDFGAVGNGVANDTAAIQLALDSGALAVYFPAGTYLIDSVSLYDNQKVYGDGANSILRATNATADILVSGGTTGIIHIDSISNVEVCSLKFQGINRPQNNNPASQDGDRGVDIVSATGVNVHDCFVDGFWSFGIVSSGGNKIRVSNNQVTNIGNQSCIACSNSTTDFIVSGNILQNGKLYGVEAENESEFGVISANNIDNCVAGIGIVTSKKITVTGNSIKDCNNVNTISNASGIGIYLIGDVTKVSEDITISGNSIFNCKLRAILCQRGHVNVSVDGNTISGGADYVTIGDPLIEFVTDAGFGPMDTISISSNNIDCTDNRSCFIGSRNTDFNFQGNAVSNVYSKVFTFLTPFSYSNIQLPWLNSIANALDSEDLPQDISNTIFTDRYPEYVVYGSPAIMQVKLAKPSKLIGIDWSVNPTSVAGGPGDEFKLYVDNVDVGSIIPSVANKDTWERTQLNINFTSAVTANTCFEVKIENVSTLTVNYVKFRVLLM